MFSGIVEECAKVVGIEKDRENVHFTLTCSFVNELGIDQSVSHNGVCLTVVKKTADTYVVTAMKETLDRSNLGLLEVGDEVYQTFEKEGFPMELISKKYEKWHIDLPECNRLQLVAAGIPETHIAVSPVCTFQQSDTFFSARKLSINSGRIFTGILLQESNT